MSLDEFWASHSVPYAVPSYGTPITLDDFEEELSNKEVDPNLAAQSVVRQVTARVESSLVELTVNAVDWCVVMASDIYRPKPKANADQSPGRRYVQRARLDNYCGRTKMMSL